MKVDGPLYVGCTGPQLGHFIHRADGSRIYWSEAGGRLGDRHLDSHFCPPKTVGEEGLAALTATADEDGRPVTILAFWDRSVDRRGGSHSTFVLPGDLDFGDALDAARAAFPQIFARYDFPVVPYREPS